MMNLAATPTTNPPNHHPNNHNNNENASSTNNNDNNDPTELVRNIASYLSLSEVESIGSLYSLVSGGPSSRGSSTPFLQNQHHHQQHHGYHQQSSSTHYNYGYNQLHHGSGLHNSVQSFVPMMEEVRERDLLELDNDALDDTIHSNMNSTAAAESGTVELKRGGKGDVEMEMTVESAAGSVASGPDAGAGMGISMNVLNNHNNHDEKRDDSGDKSNPFPWAASKPLTKGINQDTATKQQHDNNGSPLAVTPGLVALSPLDGVDDDDSDDYEQQKDYAQVEEQESQKQKQQQQKEQFQKIQQKLQTAVLSHPQSIRSYCQSSQRAAAKLRRKRREELSRERRRKQILTMIQETSRRNEGVEEGSLVKCPNCSQPVKQEGRLQRRRKRRLSEDSSAVLSVDEDDFGDLEESRDDDDQDQNDNQQQQDNDDIEAYIATCSCYILSQNQNHLSNNIQSNDDENEDYTTLDAILHHPPSPRGSNSRHNIHILRLLTNPIVKNIPLSIIFDVSLTSIHMSTQTTQAYLKLNIKGIRSILTLLIYTIQNIWSHLTSMLHPRRVLDLVVHV